MVCRVSASFIRFGTFQLPASREEFHNIPRLADYVIRHHYPQFEGARTCRAVAACLPGTKDKLDCIHQSLRRFDALSPVDSTCTVMRRRLLLLVHPSRSGHEGSQ